jgi:protein-S-isoprenylcysteine O-methyltransferase Ste14
MARNRAQAAREFRRIMKWIVVVGVLMVVAALVYLRLMDAWSLHAVIATILGVFISTLLGCGLFALAFFSDKSGHDEDVSHTTEHKDR